LLVGYAVRFKEGIVFIDKPIGCIKQIDDCLLVGVTKFGLLYFVFDFHYKFPKKNPRLSF
jgi:hypothetical protein